MAVTQRLELRQSQSLVMTPQLQQAIKLLQLSNLELAAYVDRELEQNPLLEREESDVGGDENGAAVSDSPKESRNAEDIGALRDSMDLTSAETLPSSDQAPLDTDYANDYTNDAVDDWPSETAASGTWTGHSQDPDGDATGLDQRLSREPSLRDRLLEQLQMDLNNPTDRIIGLHLVDQLDDAGYLTADLSSLAVLLGCDVARIEATLKLMQRFEPSGIFARDLRECLSLQLAERDRLDPAMAKLI